MESVALFVGRLGEATPRVRLLWPGRSVIGSPLHEKKFELVVASRMSPMRNAGAALDTEKFRVLVTPLESVTGTLVVGRKLTSAAANEAAMSLPRMSESPAPP